MADYDMLQASINCLRQWSNRWLLKLNAKKCKSISFGKDSIEYLYSMGGSHLEREFNITDLGVILDTKLSFSEHIQSKISKAFCMLGVIKRNF